MRWEVGLFWAALAAPWGVGVFAALRPSKVGAPYGLLRALGVLSLSVVPAVVVQTVGIFVGCTASRSPSKVGPRASGFSFGRLRADSSFSRAFDRWVKDLTGHRQATMIDNLHVYAAATVLWLLAWAWWIARGVHDGGSAGCARRATDRRIRRRDERPAWDHVPVVGKLIAS
jgi:hypothetical protein